jgi:hypothetical protein
MIVSELGNENYSRNGKLQQWTNTFTGLFTNKVAYWGWSNFTSNAALLNSKDLSSKTILENDRMTAFCVLRVHKFTFEVTICIIYYRSALDMFLLLINLKIHLQL